MEKEVVELEEKQSENPGSLLMCGEKDIFASILYYSSIPLFASVLVSISEQ